MYLQKGTKIKNYIIEDYIVDNSENVFYNAVNETTGETVKICEFFLRESCTRNDKAVVSEALKEGDYNRKLNQFKASAEMIKTIDLNEVIKIKETVLENNTCYVIYEQTSDMPLMNYIIQKGGKLNYKEAYELLSPFFRSLNYMFNNGVYFAPKIDNIKILPNGTIRLEDFYISDYSVNYCVDDLANIFYTLLTGKSYKDTLSKPSAEGAIVTEKLDNLIYDTLYANTTYPSIEDFANKVKDIVLFDAQIVRNPNSTETVILEADKPIESPGFNMQPPNMLPNMPGTPPMPMPSNPSKLNSGIEANFDSARVVETGGTFNNFQGQQSPPSMINQGQNYIPPNMNQNQFPPNNFNNGFNQNPNMYNPQQQFNAPPPPPDNSKKFLFGCLGVGCVSIVILIIVILLFFGNVFKMVTESEAFQEGFNEGYYGSEVSPSESEWEYNDWEYNLESTMAHTNYYYGKVGYEGTVIEDENNIYYRNWENDQWVLSMSYKSDITNHVNIAENVMPQFMQISNNMLYYVDAIDDSTIKVIDLSQMDEPEEIVGTKSAFIQIKDNYIYYINLEEWAVLYRYNMDTSQHEKVSGTIDGEYVEELEAEYLVIEGDKAVFIGYTEDYDPAIMTLDLNTAEVKTLYSSPDTIWNAQVANGIVYFSKISDQKLLAVYLDGNTEEIVAPVLDLSIYSFDIFGNIIYYSNYDEGYLINAYNMETGETFNTDIDAFFFEYIGGNLYYYDSVDEELHIRISESGDSAPLYENTPVYSDTLTVY